jgi:hypothetical protein
MPKCILQMFKVSQSLDRKTFWAEILGQYVETGHILEDTGRFNGMADLAQRMAMTISLARHSNAWSEEAEMEMGPVVIKALKMCFIQLNDPETIDRIKETGPHDLLLDEIINLMRFIYIDQKLIEMDRYRNDPLYPENGKSPEFLSLLHTMQESWLEMINCPGVCTECFIKDEKQRNEWIGNPVDEYSRFIEFPDTIQ